MGDVAEPAANSAPIVVVTGFSCFSGVMSNPTEQLVLFLQTEPKQRGHFDLAASTVLEVSARQLPERLRELRSRLEADGNRQVVWVHLGVDARGSHLKLEGAAYNCADFRCKDTSGWQPSRVSIDDSLPLDAPLHTDLPVAQLAADLTAGSEGAFDVRVSDDPGRFVCNYIYFLSLREAAAHPGWHALFVHVPAFAVVGESVQRTFLVRLLRGIAELPQLQTPSLAAIANSVADEEPLSVTAVSKLGEKEAQGPGQHAALVWTASAAAVTYLASMN